LYDQPVDAIARMLTSRYGDVPFHLGYLVAGLKPFAGRYGVDEPRVRAVVTRMHDRTTDTAASQTNHWILDGGQSIRGQLGDITAPTLILHGTDDPLFPMPTQRRMR